ncbi:hypothetical protein RIF29_19318 [Crotalaria pallida]|uniref:Uncharacterized protein n=1 Tax=Crotalaria pallida TaxID=3830 RepID=A0AAN9F358_CROPI
MALHSSRARGATRPQPRLQIHISSTYHIGIPIAENCRNKQLMQLQYHIGIPIAKNCRNKRLIGPQLQSRCGCKGSQDHNIAVPEFNIKPWIHGLINLSDIQSMVLQKSSQMDKQRHCELGQFCNNEQNLSKIRKDTTNLEIKQKHPIKMDS